MSEHTFQQAAVCQRIENGIVSIKEGATQLNMSYRNILRVYKKYQTSGVKGLIHKGIGKESNHKYPNEKKEEILSLISTHYQGYSSVFTSELLEEEHAIKISPSTLRRWLHPIVPIKSRAPQYRARRPRMEHFGRMIQGDGSFHHWFGDAHPPCCLLVLIDDATNTVQLRFAEQEYAQDMLILLKQWVVLYGIPVTLYFDKRNAYVHNPQSLRYIPYVAQSLGIEIINANTPQAKGRVERVNRTLQDRLVKELTRREITSIEDANKFLEEYYIDRFNTRFSIPPQSEKNAHVPIVAHYDLDSRFAKPFVRTLQNDWTFSLHNATYQVEKANYHPSLRPNKKIIALQYLDNSFKAFYNKIELKVKEVM